MAALLLFMMLCRLAPLALLLIAGCDWVSLARGALTYETLRAGDAATVVVIDSVAYVAIGDSGIAVVDGRSGARLATLAPPAGSESVDDLAVGDGLVFALDARAPGHLSVLAADGARLTLRSGPRPVDVGPFSGVDARDGLCVVSGGTSRLTLWRYDTAGQIAGPVATADLGRGQPDATLGPSGLVYVSTHYWGPRFGIDIVRYDSAARELRAVASLPLEGAGFTPGGAKPANFPMDAALLDDTTVVVAFARGLAVLNVRDPAQPRLERVIDLGGRGVSVAVREREAIVAVAGPRAAVVHIDFAGVVPRVTQRQTLPPGTNPQAVAFSWQHSVIAARDKGVLVLR